MAIRSEAQKRATAKYHAEHMECISVRYQKGVKDMIQDHTALTGESMASFILRAVKETIARDRETGKVHPLSED